MIKKLAFITILFFCAFSLSVNTHEPVAAQTVLSEQDPLINEQSLQEEVARLSGLMGKSWGEILSQWGYPDPETGRSYYAQYRSQHLTLLIDAEYEMVLKVESIHPAYRSISLQQVKKALGEPTSNQGYETKTVITYQGNKETYPKRLTFKSNQLASIEIYPIEYPLKP